MKTRWATGLLVILAVFGLAPPANAEALDAAAVGRVPNDRPKAPIVTATGYPSSSHVKWVALEFDATATTVPAQVSVKINGRITLRNLRVKPGEIVLLNKRNPVNTASSHVPGTGAKVRYGYRFRGDPRMTWRSVDL